MAYDKVVDSAQLDADLKIVADAIRAKSGKTEPLEFPQGMADAVDSFETGITPTGTIEITENGTYDVTEYANAEVNVSGEEEFIGIKLSGFEKYPHYAQPTEADLRSLQSVVDNSVDPFNGFPNLFANNNANGNGGAYVYLETVYLPSGLTSLSVGFFRHCKSLKNIYGDLTKITTVGINAFYECSSLGKIPYWPSLTKINQEAFYGCTGITEFKFYSTATTIHSRAFTGCTNLLDIYVPWSEGEVANAPWGAVNATIHYNTVYDENHNPIIQEV